MKLYFESASGEMREIAELENDLSLDETVDDALYTLSAFCYKHQFHIFGVRVTEAHRLGRPMLQFDVGSHTEFFFLEWPPQHQ